MSETRRGYSALEPYQSREPCSMGRRWIVLVLWIALLIFLIAVAMRLAHGRDLDGRYSNSRSSRGLIS
jgi:putative exporter of polyketide antibiotics